MGLVLGSQEVCDGLRPGMVQGRAAFDQFLVESVSQRELISMILRAWAYKER